MYKEIRGYEDLYYINEYGVIKKKCGKIIKPFDNKGYDRVQLTDKNGRAKKFLIHRLVLSTFSPVEDFENLQVNHKDMNKRNNHISNLEWVTNLQNCRHKLENKPELREQARARMSDIGKEYSLLGVEASKKKVARVDLVTNEVIETYESARDASRKHGFNYKNISQVCKKERKTHKGYGWIFI